MHGEVLYSRKMSFDAKRKRPMDGVVEIGKANLAEHGFDGFIGYCVGHPQLLRNHAHTPASLESASLEQFLEAEVKNGSQKTASEILAVWSAKTNAIKPLPTAQPLVVAQPSLVDGTPLTNSVSSPSTSLASSLPIAGESQIISKANELRRLVLNSSQNSKYRAMMERSFHCAESKKATPPKMPPRGEEATGSLPNPSSKPALRREGQPKPATTDKDQPSLGPVSNLLKQPRTGDRDTPRRGAKPVKGARSKPAKRTVDRVDEGMGQGRKCDHHNLGVYGQSYFTEKLCQKPNYPSTCSKCRKCLFRKGPKGSTCHTSKGLHDFFCCVNAVNDPCKPCVHVLCQGCYGASAPKRRRRQ